MTADDSSGPEVGAVRRGARARAALGQLRVHRAFRIPPPEWDAAQCDRLERLTPPPPPPAPSPPPPAPPPPGLDDRTIAGAVTNMWRALRRTERPGPDPAQELRRVRHHLRSSLDDLADAGLDVRDHDGETYHAGQALDVRIIEHDPALDPGQERVRETLRPSIHLPDRRLQMGEVIVASGRPEGHHDA